ncbi:glycoside hydrolase family 108 protein [Martelella sp. HB161492]|uniref:glycoside hydrolase family 108 protein n=1 Tax=Martelella sp. HB161492 TaxID=2720726 RepID=UPI0015911D49|nr:glycoside hydrolase family 108 protein [Martelella sp. HB161492]
MDAFETCLQATLQEEGGYSNDPQDPGGATMHGVTQQTYDRFRHDQNLPVQAVKDISDDEVSAIYHQYYWVPIGGDQLPKGVDLAVFDAAVNSGPNRAMSWLQQALNQLLNLAPLLTIDGVLGPQTQLALQLVEDAVPIAGAVSDERLDFLKSLPDWSRFGPGWSNRVQRIREESCERARETTSTATA